ncbi:MAG: hypothetical protein JF924_11200 [Candidatus Dormibacteraeota bacterium]|nr:hypothetical protein [Candidatus Dormibacteraeota bacterium]
MWTGETSGKDLISALTYVAVATSWVLGAVFLVSSASKIRAPAAFADNVASYGLLPDRMARLLGYLLIPTEACLGFISLAAVNLTASLLLSLALLAVFLGATSLNLHRGRAIPCGCFGDERELISIRTVIRLVVLSLAAASCLLLQAVVDVPTTLELATSDHGVTRLISALLLAAYLFAGGSWLIYLGERIPWSKILLSTSSVTGDVAAPDERP